MRSLPNFGFQFSSTGHGITEFCRTNIRAFQEGMPPDLRSFFNFDKPTKGEGGNKS
jgi:hypothetical protein